MIEIVKLSDMEFKITVTNKFKMENFSREVDSIKIIKGNSITEK